MKAKKVFGIIFRVLLYIAAFFCCLYTWLGLTVYGPWISFFYVPYLLSLIAVLVLWLVKKSKKLKKVFHLLLIVPIAVATVAIAVEIVRLALAVVRTMIALLLNH